MRKTILDEIAAIRSDADLRTENNGARRILEFRNLVDYRNKQSNVSTIVAIESHEYDEDSSSVIFQTFIGHFPNTLFSHLTVSILNNIYGHKFLFPPDSYAEIGMYFISQVPLKYLRPIFGFGVNAERLNSQIESNISTCVLVQEMLTNFSDSLNHKEQNSSVLIKKASDFVDSQLNSLNSLNLDPPLILPPT